MSKRYLCGTDLIDVLEGQGLSIEARYLFRCLLANTYLSVDGLYRMTPRNLVHVSGIPGHQLAGTVDELARAGLMVYDNELLFIARIPDEQSLLGKAGWWSILRRSRDTYHAWCSDGHGTINRAYAAFLRHHRALFERIDSPDFSETETRARKRKAAGPQESDGFSDVKQHTQVSQDTVQPAQDSDSISGAHSSKKQLPAPTKNRTKNSSPSSSRENVLLGSGGGESPREGGARASPLDGRMTTRMSGGETLSIGDVVRSMFGAGQPLHPS